MTTETRTRVLPATGRTVPAEPAYELSGFKQMETLDGVAYNARVKVGGKFVGAIENGGHGGDTWFYPSVPTARGEWDAFAAAYYTINPPEDLDAVGFVPDPADALIDEADLAKRLNRSVKGGTVVLRETLTDDAAQVAWRGDGFPTLRFAIPGCKDHARALAAAVRHPSCADGKYETYLPGTGWVLLTATVAD